MPTGRNAYFFGMRDATRWLPRTLSGHNLGEPLSGFSDDERREPFEQPQVSTPPWLHCAISLVHLLEAWCDINSRQPMMKKKSILNFDLTKKNVKCHASLASCVTINV